MRMKMLCVLLVGAMVAAESGRAVMAQEQAAARPAEQAPVSLKVSVVITRSLAEKQTSRLPFVMWVNTGNRDNQNGCSLRMGSEVPVPQAIRQGDQQVQSYAFRSTGTSIDCSATDLGNGQFKISLTVDDSQISPVEATAQRPGMPGFTVQNFKSQNAPILRHGEVVQYAVATDKVTGEIIKLEVSLTVVK